MENNTVMENSPEQGGETGKPGKTFTQAEVDEIVGKRLAREKEKAADASTAKEEQLSKKEMELNIKLALIDNNLPRELAEIIRVDKPEDIDRVMTTLKEYIKRPEAETKTKESPRGFAIGKVGGEELKNANLFRDVMGLPSI